MAVFPSADSFTSFPQFLHIFVNRCGIGVYDFSKVVSAAAVRVYNFEIG